MNLLEPSVVEAIRQLLYEGQSTRHVARDLDISPVTVARYKKILLADAPHIMCGCGLLAFHQGWCSYRFARSPRRQEFMRRWLAGRPPKIIRIKLPEPTREVLSYPFIPRSQEGPHMDGKELILLVNGLVPKNLPEQIRGDVCQEIIAAVLAGDLERENIKEETESYIRRTKKLNSAHYLAFSIDGTRKDGRPWHEVLASPSGKE